MLSSLLKTRGATALDSDELVWEGQKLICQVFLPEALSVLASGFWGQARDMPEKT